MTANDGQCLNLVSSSASNWSAVVGLLTLLDRTLVHRRYIPNNVGTHLQLSILRQMKMHKLQKRTMPSVAIEPTTVLCPTP